jgi:hypothetical protein
MFTFTKIKNCFYVDIVFLLLLFLIALTLGIFLGKDFSFDFNLKNKFRRKTILDAQLNQQKNNFWAQLAQWKSNWKIVL